MSNGLAVYKGKLLITTSICVMSFICHDAMAGSFLLHEQNTTYLGNAYAGTASTCEDASTTYFNPAGLTELKHTQIVASAVYYHGHIKLYNASARNDLGGLVNASSTTHPGSNAVIPAFFINKRINHRWAVGFGVLAPFGLNTRYASNSIARYVATKSSITTIDFTPAISYKFNDSFSVGAGFDAMFTTATLNTAINFGTEGFIKNHAHAWAYGFHVGALFKPTNETSMGLAYFSVFTPTVKGKTSTLGYPLPPAPTSLRATVDYPDRVVYSITHQYSPKWTAVGDVEWTHWSRLTNLLLVYNKPNTTTNFQLNNKNTWRVSLGANYTLSDVCLIKGGLAYDESPVRTQYRIANLPDSDKYWLAFGVKYKLMRALAIDVAYAHLFFKGCTINQRGSVGQTLTGNYKNYADLIGMQLTWSFI